jgi:Nuclease-related domain
MEEAGSLEPLLSDGEAGASARREGERRRAKREAATMARRPRLGKLILAVLDEPHAGRSWGKGAVGEEALGAKLSKLASERRVMLHDRRVPGSRANIDHIAVTPGGVFVIDAKRYSGAVEKRNVGSIFRSDVRLYVGRRECTKLLHGSEDQAEVVRDALDEGGDRDGSFGRDGARCRRAVSDHRSVSAPAHSRRGEAAVSCDGVSGRLRRTKRLVSMWGRSPGQGHSYRRGSSRGCRAWPGDPLALQRPQTVA